MCANHCVGSSDPGAWSQLVVVVVAQGGGRMFLAQFLRVFIIVIISEYLCSIFLQSYQICKQYINVYAVITEVM